MIARDVKIQVDLDPSVVRTYRLVSSENRDIKDRDFRNDKVDAGEVGAGHTVTAVYDVVLTRTDKSPVTVRVRHKAARGGEQADTATSYNNVGSTLRALGEHRKALEMAARALDLRRELLGERHPYTVNSAIGVLLSLRALGRKTDLFVLANDLVSRLPPSTPRYEEIVSTYNDTCPPGFRRLGPEGPKGQTGKEKGKKRR